MIFFLEAHITRTPAFDWKAFLFIIVLLIKAFSFSLLEKQSICGLLAIRDRNNYETRIDDHRK